MLEEEELTVTNLVRENIFTNISTPVILFNRR